MIMGFFTTMLQTRNLNKHDGRPLWKYNLSREEFSQLVNNLGQNNPDYRDFTLFYAEWWKNQYNGGIPSKEQISVSSKINNIFRDPDDFYKKAITGAQILGIKWIKKQKTLRFRTLLLQGGLPLCHITNNSNAYEKFLYAVLDEQPETIEDFILKQKIINLLPRSAQNTEIYENCLEIIKAILRGESFYDELYESNSTLKDIGEKLKTKAEKIRKRKEEEYEYKKRISKPKIYWSMDLNSELPTISLNISLADYYDSDSLSIMLGKREIKEHRYDLFLNNDLICVFRKTSNGSFKRDWFPYQEFNWIGDSDLPEVYVMSENEKFYLPDFIEVFPDFNQPSLWVNIADEIWSLVKGHQVPQKKCSVMCPQGWFSDSDKLQMEFNNNLLNWIPFEGELILRDNKNNEIHFYSDVQNLDWIISSKMPSWMEKCNLPVVQGKLEPIDIQLFDIDNNRLNYKEYNCYFRKYKTDDKWKKLSSLAEIPLGCVELKIEKDGITAFDLFYNIGNYNISYLNNSNSSFEIYPSLNSDLAIEFDKNNLVSIDKQKNFFKISLTNDSQIIPSIISCSIKLKEERALTLKIKAPFEGLFLSDRRGKKIDSEELYLPNLQGIRIISNGGDISIKIRNSLNRDIKVYKKLNLSCQPLMSFYDEIKSLFYLGDSMDIDNHVDIEITDEKSKTREKFKVKGFSHTLYVGQQIDNLFSIENSEIEFELFAIPLNSPKDNIELIPLIKYDNYYKISNLNISNQFIVISDILNGVQLMPRYINLDENYKAKDKEERIENYHIELSEMELNDIIWKQCLGYYKICKEKNLPFSTLDQLRAVGRSSKVAARFFIFLLINEEDYDNFFKDILPNMEKDLGICFHWIRIDDWIDALKEANNYIGNIYFEDVKVKFFNLFKENINPIVLDLIQGKNLTLDQEKLRNNDLIHFRSKLGPKVLGELPKKLPFISKEYNLPFENHERIWFLLTAPIAVAEAIKGVQNSKFSLWAKGKDSELMRKHIQYAQYLDSTFYNRVLSQILKTM
jgi:hypothetical protein